MQASLDHLKRHLEELVVSIGPRVMGSREDQRAIDYITAQLRGWGVEARLHRIACPCWQHRRTSLSLLWSDEELTAQGCQFSTACDVVGEAVVTDTFAKVNDAAVEGKICLMPGGISPSVTQRNLLALALQARGARALIASRKHANAEVYDGKFVREPDLRRMPVACVSARVMERLLATPSPLRLVIDADFWWGFTYNLEAIVPGRDKGRVFVTAHRDTGAGAPGAWDNGAAVAIGLELARVFAQQAPPCELRIVFTGAHERLGQGAEDYARDHRVLLADGLMALNLDGVGRADSPPTVTYRGSEAFVGRLRQLFEPGGWPLQAQESASALYDVGPFAEAGMPAVMLSNELDSFHSLHHTQLDDLSAVSLEAVRLTAERAMDVICAEIWRA